MMMNTLLDLSGSSIYTALYLIKTRQSYHYTKICLYTRCSKRTFISIL